MDPKPDDRPIELTTASDPDASVIWLHGLGADGHDFMPIVPELGLAGLRLRFVFPHAPFRPVTINGGHVMRAWFDLLGLRGAAQDEAGLRDAASRLEALIAAETARGIAPERIVLAGFSQGGAVALHTGLRHGARLAGLLALSTYLPLADKAARERAPASAALPVFMAHGSADSIIPFDLARQSMERLRALGADVAWHTYPMGHAVCAPEIADIAEWLRQRLA